MEKKRIITIDEFFRFKEMFQGLPDDQAIACELYNNADFADKELVDKLMAKALVFKDRVDFCIAVKYTFKIGSFNSNRIYTFIKASKVDKIYMDILRKIKEHD
jgi:hypothetical protein